VLTKDTDRGRIASSVEQALKLGNQELIVSIIKDPGFTMPQKPKKMEDEFFSEKFACPVCNIFLPEVEPRIFSFNTPHGACPMCSGLGTILTVDKDLVFNNNLTIGEGGVMPYQNLLSHDTWFSRTFIIFCRENNIAINKRLSDISEDQKNLLLNGTGEKLYYVEGENRWGRETAIQEPFEGILHDLRVKYQSTDSMFLRGQIEKYMRYETCPECGGARLKKEALSVTINNKSIVAVSDMAISDAYDFVEKLSNIISEREKEIGKLVLKEIKLRLSFLVDVGLDYLTLSRGAQTLAGGL
jgi:excinuclease ABC subunit A